MRMLETASPRVQILRSLALELPLKSLFLVTDSLTPFTALSPWSYMRLTVFHRTTQAPRPRFGRILSTGLSAGSLNQQACQPPPWPQVLLSACGGLNEP